MLVKIEADIGDGSIGRVPVILGVGSFQKAAQKLKLFIRKAGFLSCEQRSLRVCLCGEADILQRLMTVRSVWRRR